MPKSTRFWVLSVLTIGSLLIGTFVFKAVMGLGNVNDWTLIYSWYKYVSFATALIVGGGLFQFMFTNKGSVGYLEEVIVEVKKVVWPQQKEVKVSTVAVIIVTLVFSVILAAFDGVWALTLRAVFSLAEELL